MRSFRKISGTVFNLHSGYEYIVETAMFNVQRTITPKVGKPELQSMSSACCLIVINICVKFCENILKGFQQSRHENMVNMAMVNVQRAISPKVGKPELWFMCSACCIVLYICVVKISLMVSEFWSGHK